MQNLKDKKNNVFLLRYSILHNCYENNGVRYIYIQFEVKYNGHMTTESTFAPFTSRFF